MTSVSITTLIASLALGSLTLFLVYINWKILKISQSILQVSKELLHETVIIRIETVRLREISMNIYDESVRLRENTEMPDDVSVPFPSIGDTKKVGDKR
tara:strand:- start:661 stop:957 length:297 start_codon:yes stop_codon:yes gene_type:complete